MSKFQNFSAPQIFCEINFGQFLHLQNLESWFHVKIIIAEMLHTYETSTLCLAIIRQILKKNATILSHFEITSWK